MKISEKLPQFEQARTLLVVSGEAGFVAYLAFKGEIEETASFRIDPVRYSDKEGFTQRSGHGRVFASGSSLEQPKEKERKEFFLGLHEHLKPSSLGRVDECILFAPGYIAEEVKEHLPFKLQRCLKKTVDGNFVNVHPFELLEKLQ